MFFFVFFSRWNNGHCEYRNCLSDPQICQSLQRECHWIPWYNWQNGIATSTTVKCLCPHDQLEDHLGSCRHKCLTDNDCNVKDPGSKCLMFHCQCPTNYRRNSNSGLCEPFRCQYDDQCFNEGDMFRKCRNGTCECDYDIDMDTGKCTVYWYHLFRPQYYQFGDHVTRILLLTITIVPIVFLYCLISNIRRARSTFVPIQQPAMISFPAINRSPSTEIIQKEKQANYYANIENIANIMKGNHQRSSSSSSNFKQFKYTRFQ